MAYQVRSLADVSRSIRGAIRQYLPGTDASLKQNVLTVIGKVVALLAHEYELRLEWIYRQRYLSTASSLSIVRLHCAEYGIYQKPAAPAFGEVVGAGAPHQTYPAGVRYLSAGLTYVTTAPFTADALGSFAASVVAETSGSATNRQADAELLLADPGLYPTLSESVAVGAAGLGGGADVEDIEGLRMRGLKRKASPPQGGSLPDYENWALEVPGVVNVWAAQFANGFGSVGAWVLFAGRPNGIPEASDLAAVDQHIKDKRLVRARFATIAPRPVPVDLEIQLAPDTSTNRTAVTAALQAFFDAAKSDSRIRPGLPDAPFTLPVAWISEVISGTEGEASHTLIVPSASVVFLPGELPVLGAITWA